MRLRGITTLLDVAKYRRLKQDFKQPFQALLAVSGINRKKYTLETIHGEKLPVDRNDSAVWEQYFSGQDCAVSFENNRFKITPHDEQVPAYYILGGHSGFTDQPQRWNPGAYRSPLFKELEAAERSVYSQHGEDGVIEYLVSKIPDADHFIVEFGAYDGICMSNSRYLIEQQDWSAFLIEADERFYQKLDVLYQTHPKVQILKSLVMPDTINSLFSQANVPKRFDVLSIDIDSVDYYVWEALSDFEPKVVVIEYNSSVPADTEYVVPIEDVERLGATSQEGASLLSFYQLGQRKGYELVYSELSGANLFFVNRDYLHFFEHQALTPDELYQPPQFGLIAGGRAANGRGYPDP